MKQSHDFRPSGRHDNQIKVKQPKFPIEMNKVKQPEFPIEMTIEITQQLEVHNTHISLPGELSWQSCRCRGRVGQDVICTKLNGQNNIRQVQRQRADHKDCWFITRYQGSNEMKARCPAIRWHDDEIKVARMK